MKVLIGGRGELDNKLEPIDEDEIEINEYWTFDINVLIMKLY